MKYRFIVTGDLYAKVDAPDKDEAFERLSEWLEDNSTVSNWEILDDRPDRENHEIDIDLDEPEIIVEVSGGVAEVTKNESKARISIIDHDQ